VEYLDIWATPEPFKGSSGGQLAPGVKKTDLIDLFSTTLQKNLQLEFTRNVEVQGVKLLEFGVPRGVFQSAALNPDNAKYYAFGPTGFHNLTSAELVPGVRGIPVFVSKPHFLEVDPAVNSLVQLLQPDNTIQNGFIADPKIHDTYVRYEPITGAALDAALRLQLNVLLDGSLTPIYHPNTTSGYYPVYWAQEGATFTSKQADSFKSTVYGAQKLGNSLLVLFVVVGAVNIFVGLVLIIIPIARKFMGGADGDTEMNDLY